MAHGEIKLLYSAVARAVFSLKSQDPCTHQIQGKKQVSSKNRSKGTYVRAIILLMGKAAVFLACSILCHRFLKDKWIQPYF